MIRKRLRRRPNWPDGTGYDPLLTLTVAGTDDVYRLARLLERGQTEFAALGRRILRSMDQQEPGIVAAMTKAMGPYDTTSRYRGRRRRQVQLRLGMPAEELRELEETTR